jgi:uncharacterized protein (TIGR02996 family)
MRDEADFLRALASDPGDDVARLAFADWLTERDDPRAPWVRDPAVFRWMGPSAGDPVPALLEAVRRDEYPLSYEAETVLTRVGAAAVPVLLAEIEMAGRGAAYAGRALAGMETALVMPILDRLLQLADAEAPEIHSPAIEALQAVGPAALPALPALIRALPGGYEHWQSEVAERAVQVLKNLGPAAVDAVPVLLEQYVYPETHTTEALEAIGAAGVPKALAHIGNLDPEYCLRAADYLQPLAAEVAPLLRQALETGDQQVRAVVALALAGTDPEAALPHLLEAIESRLFEEGDVDLLVEVIEGMGPAAASAVPTLRRLLDAGVIPMDLATRALSRLESPEALGQGLLEQLQSNDPQDRVNALVMLKSLEVVPPGTRQTWLPLLEDPDPQVRLVAASLVGKLAEPGDAEAVLAVLRPLLRHHNPGIRQMAIIGCQRFGVADVAADLLPLLDHESWDVRSAVLDALQTAQGAVPAVAAALCRCLHDPLPGVRDEATRALAARPDLLAQAMDTLLGILARGRFPATPCVLYLVRLLPLPVARRVALLREGLSSQRLEAREHALYALPPCWRAEKGTRKWPP